MQRKPGHRLGLRGAGEIKDHPWLKYYPWKELYEKKLEAPFIPKSGDNFDKRYCESADKIGETTKERYEKYSRDPNFKEAFKNFTIINMNNEENTINKDRNSKDIIYNSDRKRSSMHVRSTSGISNSSNFINNSNFYSSLKINGSNQKDNSNIPPKERASSSNSINENLLRSKVKLLEKEKRISSSMNSTGMINSSLRNSAHHKHAKSYNNFYGAGNTVQQKKYDGTPDKKTSTIINDASRNSAKPNTGRLPNINNIDKLKIRKLINSSNSNLLFKYYKSNSNVMTNNTNGGLKSQIFNKKI